MQPISGIKDIKHTVEFNLAWKFVTETNLNVFLTGKAGTGKTTFLKYLRENSAKKMLIAAPTGVAAINAGGVTLHSLFQLPFSPFIPATSEPLFKAQGVNGYGGNPDLINSHSLLKQLHYNRDKLILLRNLELLVIDEVSMMPSHTVDAIDTILKSVRRKQWEPFGGVQVLFIGDLYQLPPVVKNNEWEVLKDYYPSIFFFDSHVLRGNVPVMVELKEIFRQRDDKFIGILNAIRNDCLTRENLNLLNSRLRLTPLTSAEKEYVTITTHNYQADAINKRELNHLKTPSHTFRAKIEGIFPEHLYPAEYELELKENAQVMFLRNDMEKNYFNGKTGVVTSIEEDGISVKCPREEQEINVERTSWKNIKYSLNPATREIKEEEMGCFSQYPLRLAWAITIHKSQGLTFEKLRVDAENAFANGQVYVALSRCTSLEGLMLTSPVNQSFLGAHRNLVDWTNQNQDESHLSQKLDVERQKYVLRELQNIFTWTTLSAEIQVLDKILREVITGEFPEVYLNWLLEITEKLNVLNGITTRFKERIGEMQKTDQTVETSPMIQKRIKDAANYFSNEFGKCRDLLYNHPFRFDTKKMARPVDEALEDMRITMNEILQKMNFCRNGFLLNDYMQWRKKINGGFDRLASSYITPQSKSPVVADVLHPILYKRISDLRNKIALSTNVPVYRVFRNRSIELICHHLPGSIDALHKIEGLSRVKMNKYGVEIIQLVNTYCLENNIQSKQISKEEYVKHVVTDTIKQTVAIFKTGKTISEIAKERNFAESTIEGHFAQAIRHGLIDINDVMPKEEFNLIATFFATDSKNIHLSEIKQKVSPDVSYGKLKMVMAWLQKQN